jgi:glycosyltransferase involved in cell wall biosynthesis
MALNKLGDIEGALESTKIGLQTQPDDPFLTANHKLYAAFLARREIVNQSNILKEAGILDQEKLNQVVAIINNQPTNLLKSPSVIIDGQFSVAGITDNEKEWHIPDCYDFNSFPIKLSDEQLQATVLMIWKQYILHDEIMLGIKFLENAPYSVRNTIATHKALQMNKSMIAWINDPDLAQKHNAPEEAVIDTEIGAALPHPLIGQQGSRFDAIVKYLDSTSPKTPISILDFGCFDGAFTNRYAMKGYKVIGIDLVKTSIKLANKKAMEFNTGAQHIECYFQDVADKIPHHSMDYATSTESYEHLIDPINDMLLPAKKVLKETGKFLLSCPHGAWFRGNHITWAHPWIFADSWLAPHPRGHLRAPDVWTLAKHFRQAGYWVKNSFVMLSDFPDVPGQGNVFSEAHVSKPYNDNPKDIVFYLGDGIEEWTPNTVKKTGIGGSELMAIELSKRLALQGHKVRVYSSCGLWGEGIYDGVEYYQSTKYQDINCDVLIVSRKANMIDDQYNIEAKLKLLWVHDTCALSATNELILKYDRILALSQWHKQNLMLAHNLHSDHVIVTRNGIDLTRFDQQADRNPFKCVNSSSPDRSWPILLEVWPEIKRQVPQAELHLYYGFKNWEYMAQWDTGQRDLINKLKQQIVNMSFLGVVYHDRLNQKELAKEFLKAGVWLYPTWFSESSCISAMEAQAAGLQIITSSIAALNETVADRGVRIDGDWTSLQYKQQFIQEAVHALNNNGDRASLQQYANEHFGLEQLAQQWSQIFTDLIDELKTNPIQPYNPTELYKIKS